MKLAECPSFGKPVILYDIESKGSEAYLALAKEIILKERTKGTSAPVKESGSEKPAEDLIMSSIPDLEKINFDEPPAFEQ